MPVSATDQAHQAPPLRQATQNRGGSCSCLGLDNSPAAKVALTQTPSHPPKPRPQPLFLRILLGFGSWLMVADYIESQTKHGIFWMDCCKGRQDALRQPPVCRVSQRVSGLGETSGHSTQAAKQTFPSPSRKKPIRKGLEMQAGWKACRHGSCATCTWLWPTQVI